MMKAFAALILLVSFISVSGHAQNRRSHYEVLRKAFVEATIPARMEDFESHRWDRCLYVDVNDQQTLHETKVRTLQLHTSDGGPLFPGGTDRRADIFNDPVIDQYLFSFFKNSYEASTPNYFVQVVDGPGWARMNLYAKRDRGVLLFHVATSHFSGPNTVMDPRVFGYCWNENRQRPDPRPETPPAPAPNPRPSPRPVPPPATAPVPSPRPVPPPATAPVPNPRPVPPPATAPVPNPRPVPPPATAPRPQPQPSKGPVLTPATSNGTAATTSKGSEDGENLPLPLPAPPSYN